MAKKPKVRYFPPAAGLLSVFQAPTSQSTSRTGVRLVIQSSIARLVGRK